MQQRLTPTQLEQVVAEVQKLSDRRQIELDTEQVKDILRTLDLPPELLDEALVQLQRHDALRVQQRRKHWLIGSAIGLGALLVVGTTLFFQNQQQTLLQISAQRDRLTLTQDDGGNLTTIPRQINGEIFYRVTLSDAPVGQELSLSCNWIDPSGQIVHQNQYQTRTITTPVWTTYCRHTVGAAAPVGQWQVQMVLGDRLLSGATFNVE